MYAVKHNNVVLSYWLLISAIEAIIRPILYRNFKKGWLHTVRTFRETFFKTSDVCKILHRNIFL